MCREKQNRLDYEVSGEHKKDQNRIKCNLKPPGGSSINKIHLVIKRCALNINLTKINLNERILGAEGRVEKGPPTLMCAKNEDQS